MLLAAEHVTFPSADGDVTLAAALLRPEGRGPFPAAVLLHGCGGLWGNDAPP
jgi:dienelactone hydrolase